MPWLGDGAEQGFLPNNIADIINKKHGQNLIDLDFNKYYSAVINNDFSQLKNKLTQITQKSLKVAIDNQGNISKEDRALQFINDANKYIEKEDIKNAISSIYMARIFDETKKYKSQIEKIEFKLIISHELDCLITKIRSYIKKGKYSKSYDLIRKATKLARTDKEYLKRIENLEKLTINQELDYLLIKANDYISDGNFSDAYNLIEKANNLAGKNENYLKKITKIKNSIAMQQFKYKFQEYTDSNNFKKAIYLAVNLLKKDPYNCALNDYISKLEDQDTWFQRCEKACNIIRDLYKKGDYIIAYNELYKVISIAKQKEINTTKYTNLMNQIKDML